jgi:hypothetical protein
MVKLEHAFTGKKNHEFWQGASNYSKNYHFTDLGDLNCDQSGWVLVAFIATKTRVREF